MLLNAPARSGFRQIAGLENRKKSGQAPSKAPFGRLSLESPLFKKDHGNASRSPLSRLPSGVAGAFFSTCSSSPNSANSQLHSIPDPDRYRAEHCTSRPHQVTTGAGRLSRSTAHIPSRPNQLRLIVGGTLTTNRNFTILRSPVCATGSENVRPLDAFEQSARLAWNLFFACGCDRCRRRTKWTTPKI